MNFTITPNFTQAKNNKAQLFNNFSFAAQNPNLPANSNLAPLARDTVSFGAAAKAKKVARVAQEVVAETVNGLKSEKVAEGVIYNNFNYGIAVDLEKEAIVPMGYFQNIMNRYLRKYVSTEMGSDSIIQDMRFRVKTKDSIYEKMETLGYKANKKAVSGGSAAYASTKRDAANLLGDVIGGRIVMRDSSKKAVKKVLQILGQVVKDGRLKIADIESYAPIISEIPRDVLKAYKKELGINLDEKKLREITKPGYFSYADDKDIAAFADICRSTNRGLKVDNGLDRPNGYQAIHLGFILPDGSKGELQILSRDVEILKELEDFVYKAKCKKKIKNEALAERLKPFADPKEDALREMFDDYSRWAFIGQRLKDDLPFTSKVSERFLTAPKPILEREVGFNQLLKLKKQSSAH